MTRQANLTASRTLRSGAADAAVSAASELRTSLILGGLLVIVILGDGCAGQFG